LVRIRLDFFEIDEDLIAVASASNPSIQEPEGRRSVLLADLGEQSLRKPG
jgi:hypothetical protein